MTAMTQEPEPIDPASGDRDSNVRLLHEAAKSQPVYRCSFFVDIVGSSTRKNTEPEASWITQSDMLYTIVEDAIEEFLPNGWYKNTGDGFVVVSSDDPEQVMNSAVSIQESLADARSGHQSAGIARMDISVSIGITSGHVYEYRGRNGRVDYLGLMLDKAARLTAVASANAIFVDRATVQDAAMRKIHSRVGEVLRYTGDEYVGMCNWSRYAPLTDCMGRAGDLLHGAEGPLARSLRHIKRTQWTTIRGRMHCGNDLPDVYVW